MTSNRIISRPTTSIPYFKLRVDFHLMGNLVVEYKRKSAKCMLILSVMLANANAFVPLVHF